MPDISKAWAWAVETCNAPSVGYSQTYRNQQTVNGVTYYDCSSFINFALLAGGWETPSYAPNHNAFTTWSEASALEALGFKEVTDGSLKVGDIGFTHHTSGDEVQHTEMVYKVDGNRAQWMGAHSPNVPLADQVSISENWVTGKRFDHLYRYETEEPEPPEPQPPEPQPTVKKKSKLWLYIFPNIRRNPNRMY